MSEALEGYEDEARRSPERVSWRATIVRGNIMFKVVYCTGDTIYRVPRVVGVVRKGCEKVRVGRVVGWQRRGE